MYASLIDTVYCLLSWSYVMESMDRRREYSLGDLYANLMSTVYCLLSWSYVIVSMGRSR